VSEGPGGKVENRTGGIDHPKMIEGTFFEGILWDCKGMIEIE
jgi:hypothetical protein